MERDEHIVQVIFKPNCGLENTRAALVARRAASSCAALTYYPRTVKSDQGTIPYLRDHGFFIRFQSNMPEQVLSAVNGSFFVDRCSLVDDPSSIPPLEALENEDDADDATPLAAASFADCDARDEREDELTGLLARFEEANRALRKRAESYPQDRALDDILFTHAQAVDGLRTAVERSRIEPFDRLAPSLRKLANDYGRRFGIAVNLELEEGRVALDRAVLATMEETIKHVVRSRIRDGIDDPEKRAAAGKPARGTIRLRVENDGSDVTCRIEHDGHPFNAQLAGKLAVERGLLTRPLDTYTDDEIGSFLLLPRFSPAGTDGTSKAFSEFNEIGSILQRAGGHGAVRNTAWGTVEIALHFPVPFTVLEVAFVRTGETVFALPVQQIKRFDAFRADRVQTTIVTEGDTRTARAFFVDETGERYELLNEQEEPSPIDAVRPSYVLLLESLGSKRALAADSVHGYERVSVNQLPPLIDRGTARAMGCIGYAVPDNGTPHVVISLRRLINAENEGEHHA